MKDIKQTVEELRRLRRLLGEQDTTRRFWSAARGKFKFVLMDRENWNYFTREILQMVGERVLGEGHKFEDEFEVYGWVMNEFRKEHKVDGIALMAYPDKHYIIMEGRYLQKAMQELSGDVYREIKEMVLQQSEKIPERQ